jgi:hypothetical protein
MQCHQCRRNFFFHVGKFMELYAFIMHLCIISLCYFSPQWTQNSSPAKILFQLRNGMCQRTFHKFYMVEAEFRLFWQLVSLEFIFDYLNGTRTLSNDQLSYLVVSQCDPAIPDFQLFICAPHFLGDGASLNQLMHDLLVILTSLKSDIDLEQDLRDLLKCNSLRWVSNLQCTAGLT